MQLHNNYKSAILEKCLPHYVLHICIETRPKFSYPLFYLLSAILTVKVQLQTFMANVIIRS